MTVEQLIKRLSKFDPKSTVTVVDNRWHYQTDDRLAVKRVRVSADGSLCDKGERDESAESVVLITFRGAGA